MTLAKHKFLAGFLAGSGAPLIRLRKYFKRQRPISDYSLIVAIKITREEMELEGTKNVQMKGTESLIDGVSRKPQLKQARDFFVDLI